VWEIFKCAGIAREQLRQKWAGVIVGIAGQGDTLAGGRWTSISMSLTFSAT